MTTAIDEVFVIPVALRKHSPSVEVASDLEQAVFEYPLYGANHRLICAFCYTPITSDDQRIVVAGSHEHTCTNPLGYRFHIGCFRDVPGCRQDGPATQAHTWFEGYAWRTACCNNCRRHLGWCYDNRDGDCFHGLILRHLVQAR